MFAASSVRGNVRNS